jgi:phage terminase large subunit GpA-like protein
MFCSQFLGKSSILEGILAWSIEEAPTAVVVVCPTVDNSAVWSKNRFTPLIESIPALNALVSKKSEASKLGAGQNTITRKSYPGGWLVAGGANSPNQLAAHTARLTVFDEVDRFPTIVGGRNHEEGDPILLVEQRSARFTNAFSIKTSTPTVKNFSRIEKEYERSDRRRWFVKCPKCKKEFVIAWAHIKWDRTVDEKGTVIDENPESAYIECPTCERKISDVERERIVRAGRWVATNPKVKNRRGYAANAFLVQGPPKEGYRGGWLHYFVARYLDERALGTKGMREWQNLVLGETFELETDPPPDFLALHGRRELYDEYEGEVVVPERVILLVCGIDVQRTRIEYEIVGWGLNDESWGIHYGTVYGNVQSPKFWDEEVKPLIDKRWRHATGHLISPYATFIDTGDKPHQMYNFVRRCTSHVYASKGYSGFVANWVVRSGGSFAKLFIVKVDTPKESLYSNLRLVEPGPGYCHFPLNERSGYDEIFFSQLTSERMVLDGPYPHFVKPHSSVRNEALDIRVLAMAACNLVTEDPTYAKARAWLASKPENDWRPKDVARVPESALVVPVPSESGGGGGVTLTPTLTKAAVAPPRISPFRPPKSGWSRVR